MGNTWGLGGPPEEAYSRVTNAERLRGLHDAARSMLASLEGGYDVTRTDGVAPDPMTGENAPMVSLQPADPDASTLAVVFTGFPGLLVQYGRAETDALPTCGCDACDDTLADLTEHLSLLLRAVAAGTVGERLHRDGLVWWRESWTEAPDTCCRTRVERAQIEALRAAMPGDEKRWAAWPRRT